MSVVDDNLNKLRELLDYDGESGNRELTTWELDFIDSLDDQMDCIDESLTVYSKKQVAKLNQIWSAIFS